MKELTKIWSAHSGKIIAGIIVLAVIYFYMKPKKKAAAKATKQNGGSDANGGSIVHEDQDVGMEGIAFGGTDDQDYENTDGGIDLAEQDLPGYGEIEEMPMYSGDARLASGNLNGGSTSKEYGCRGRWITRPNGSRYCDGLLVEISDNFTL